MALSSADHHILERAANKTLTAIYPDTIEACRRLADDGYLDTVGWCQYKLTPMGERELRAPVDPSATDEQITVRLPAPTPLAMVRPLPPAIPPAPPQPVPDLEAQRQSWRGRLSHRQREIMGFIEAHIKKNGFPPNIREIGEACGISSTSVVNYNLIKLEERGFLQRKPRVSRGLQVMELPGQSRKPKFHITARRITIEIPLGEDPRTVMGYLESTGKKLSDFATEYQQSHIWE